MSTSIMYNTPISTKEQKRLRRVLKAERHRRRNGDANGYKTNPKPYYGYDKIGLPVPWLGKYDNNGNLLPFKGNTQGECKIPFFINPITNEVLWHVTSPPQMVIKYVWLSRAKSIENV
jgi:hypothetical protein